jgi:chromosome segregation protein
VRDREIARTRLEADRGYLDDLCAQELGMTAGDAVAQVTPEAIADADEAALEADVAELKAKVEAIGPVNLMAIEEFQTLEERHASLSAQKKDLEDAVVSLRESIKRINRQSRERFTETFEVIREHYREIFKVLFNGGRADLVLEEGEDVLECGIDMIAQPPGKRLGHVSLLSGGEKSMAALALLFAIFRHQPSPFCLLDEVDAALDELNVGRFTRMLGEYAGQTQFILITHNKRSMESANLLYGVTMEEAGVSKLVSLAL